VRYYLNGLLLETAGSTLRAVATDGHRLALAEIGMEKAATKEEQVIVPRKGVLELNRLLEGEGSLSIVLGTNHVRVETEGTRLTSKLIDGRFPDYGRVIPDKPGGVVRANRVALREALQRTAILANEKYRGVRLELSENNMVISANNPEQEEATETLGVVVLLDMGDDAVNPVQHPVDVDFRIMGGQTELCGMTHAVREPRGIDECLAGHAAAVQAVSTEIFGFLDQGHPQAQLSGHARDDESARAAPDHHHVLFPAHRSFPFSLWSQCRRLMAYSPSLPINGIPSIPRRVTQCAASRKVSMPMTMPSCPSSGWFR